MELNNELEYKQILKENSFLMVFFYSTWCPPCRMLRPIIEEFIENNPDKIILCINTDNIKTIHKTYNIHNVPTILCIKKGTVIDIIDGFIEYEELEEKFAELNC